MYYSMLGHLIKQPLVCVGSFGQSIWRHDTKPNVAQYNGNDQNDSCHNGTKQYDTRHNDT